MDRITVSDMMTRQTITINPDENLLNCAKKMVKKRVGDLVLINKEKKVTGFLTDEDILWAIVKKSKKDLKDIRAKDIAAKKVVTIRPDADIKEAIEKMKKKKFERLPVVEKGKRLVGIITTKDILSFQPEIYPELEEISKIKEEQEKLNRIKSSKSKVIEHGVCEECGASEILYRFNGMLVCDGCKGDI